MRRFKALGKMTGGRAAEYSSIHARTLRAILGGVISDSLAQYVVGFVPDAEEHNARRHQLEIRLASKSAGTVEGVNDGLSTSNGDNQARTTQF